jgi:hypothetical protein
VTPISSTSEPGGEFIFSASKARDAQVVKNDRETLACELPAGDFAVQAIAAKGSNGWGDPVFVNRAQIQWLSRVSEGGRKVRPLRGS